MSFDSDSDSPDVEESSPPLGPRIIDLRSRFAEFDGATLDWFEGIASHHTWIFRASCPGGEVKQLHFSRVMQMETAQTMHNVRLRMATESENSSLLMPMTPQQREYLTPEWSDFGFSPEYGHLVFEAAEGLFWIWARFLHIRSGTDAAELAEFIFDCVRKPLWRGGPDLGAL